MRRRLSPLFSLSVPPQLLRRRLLPLSLSPLTHTSSTSATSPVTQSPTVPAALFTSLLDHHRSALSPSHFAFTEPSLLSPSHHRTPPSSNSCALIRPFNPLFPIFGSQIENGMWVRCIIGIGSLLKRELLGLVQWIGCSYEVELTSNKG